MSNGHYSFGPKQKRVLHVITGLLWLVGLAILRYFDGLSVFSFSALSLALVGSSSYPVKIKWWANIGIMIMGIYWIGASYLEYIDPIGNANVRLWWILGVSSILVGIYLLVQRVAADFHD